MSTQIPLLPALAAALCLGACPTLLQAAPPARPGTGTQATRPANQQPQAQPEAVVAPMYVPGDSAGGTAAPKAGRVQRGDDAAGRRLNQGQRAALLPQAKRDAPHRQHPHKAAAASSSTP